MKTWNPGGLKTYRSRGPSTVLTAGGNQDRGEEPQGQNDYRAVEHPPPQNRGDVWALGVFRVPGHCVGKKVGVARQFT